MTREDPPADDGPDEPEDVGGFRFGMADGAGEPGESGPRRAAGAGSGGSRFDLQDWLHENVPGLGGSSSGGPDQGGTETAPEASVGPTDFAGFDFGRWLQETDVRTPTSPEPETPTAETPETPTSADPEEAGTVSTVLAEESVTEPVETGRRYAGFDFRQWMTDEEGGPRKPPESPRVVGSSPSSDSSPLAGLVAALPFAGSTETEGDAYEGGFDFAAWLGEGDSEYFEPVEVETTPVTTAEPSPAPEPGTTATATAGGGGGLGEPPEFPTPSGGGISDTPPVKLAAFALFTAAIVAVALTAAGAIAPFGPADGFGSPAGGDGAQEQAVATNNSTATATPEATPEPTPEATPSPTDEPTSTPTDEPTSTPTDEPTPTPTEESTPTPTETPEEDDDGGILDPIFGDSG